MHLIRAIDAPWRKKSFLKFFQNVLLVSFNCLLGTTSHALDCSALKPYGGLEYVQRSLVFKEGYGKGDFNQRLPQAHVFLGIQINDYLGLEAGYLFSQAVTKISFAENRQALGQVLDDPVDQYTAENKINLTGPQISLVGRLPFGTSKFSVLGSIGFSLLNLKARHMRVAESGIQLSPSEIIDRIRHFSSKKVVPKCMFGLGHQLTDSIGMRILMGYEKTSQFKNITPKESKILSITLKNATLFSIGFTANF